MPQRITSRIDSEVADALDRFVSARPSDFKSKQGAYRFIWLIERRYLVGSEQEAARSRSPGEADKQKPK